MKQPPRAYPGASLATLTVAELARYCVSDILSIPIYQINNPARGDRQAAFARQLAIHLAHIVAGRRHEDVARYFKRNRSTASHNFEVLENLRDEPAFDHFLTLLEQRFTHLLIYRAAKPNGEWPLALEALARAVSMGRLEADIHFDAKFVVDTFREREPRRRVK